MSNSLPTDEEIRSRIRTAMQELIVRDSALAAHVVPCVQGAVIEIVREYRLAITILSVTSEQEAYNDARKEIEGLRKAIGEIGTLHEWAESEHIQEITELRLKIERLEASADPDALVIVYEQGRAAERAVWRKRMREQSPDGESNMDRYCRGFNDGYEFAGEQGERVGEQWQPVEDGVYDAQHLGDSFTIEGDCITIEERVIGSDEVREATIALPEGWAVCELVKAKPRESVELGKTYMQVPVGDRRPPVPKSLLIDQRHARSEAEPITAEALEREGFSGAWQGKHFVWARGDYFVHVDISAPKTRTTVDYPTADVEYACVPFPGVRTMSDLRNLVRYMGGKESEQHK